MIDITTEALIPLRDVPGLAFLPPRRSGSKLNVSTVFRWSLRGRRGNRLETIVVGGQRCTTIGALQRFFSALTLEKNQPSMSGSVSKTTTKRNQEVEAKLDRLGI